jgi:hypothetical protein
VAVSGTAAWRTSKLIAVTTLKTHKSDLPTRARMTVRRGAAGNVMATLNSSIWSRSTATERNIILQLPYHFNPIPDTHTQTAASHILYAYVNDLAL